MITESGEYKVKRNGSTHYTKPLQLYDENAQFYDSGFSLDLEPGVYYLRFEKIGVLSTELELIRIGDIQE